MIEQNHLLAVQESRFPRPVAKTEEAPTMQADSL